MKKRKFLIIAAVILIILSFAAAAYSDFGGHSHSSSSSSRSHRSRTSRNDDVNSWYFTIPFALIVTFFRQYDDIKTGLKRLRRKFRKLKPMHEYYAVDPKFDEIKFKKVISDLYVKMQETWQAKDISQIKDFMTDDFYYAMDLRLDKLRRKKQTDCTEKIKILEINLKGWRQDNEFDYIAVGLKSQIVSYIADDILKYVVSGNSENPISMEYYIEFSRNSKIKTAYKINWQVSDMDGWEMN